MRTHQELITLASDSAIMSALMFTRDGNKIIGYNDRGRLQIWRPSWAEIDASEPKENTKSNSH